MDEYQQEEFDRLKELEARIVATLEAAKTAASDPNNSSDAPMCRAIVNMLSLILDGNRSGAKP